MTSLKRRIQRRCQLTFQHFAFRDIVADPGDRNYFPFGIDDGVEPKLDPGLTSADHQ